MIILLKNTNYKNLLLIKYYIKISIINLNIKKVIFNFLCQFSFNNSYFYAIMLYNIAM